MGGLDVPCQVTELRLQSGKKWEIPGLEADLGEMQPLLEKYSPAPIAPTHLHRRPT